MFQNNQVKTPIFVILFFTFLFNFLLFFQSKKIILWEEKTEGPRGNIFKVSVFLLANFYESLKEKVGLKTFFEKEHLFWLKLKTSPVLFANINQPKKEEEIPSGEFQGEKAQREIQVTSTIETEEKEIQTSTLEIKQTHLENNLPYSKKVTQIIEEQKKSTILKKEKKFFVEGEMRILIVGNSMVAAGGGLGEMLEKELKKEFPNAKILREGKVSSGLSRPDYFNWEARLNQLVSQFNPSITILVFGLNDSQALTDSKGNVVVSFGKFGQKEWEEEYGKRVRRMVEILNQKGSFVFWVGLPIVKDPSFANKLAILNKIFEKEVKKSERAVFIPIWCVLCENGKYTDYLLNENGIRQLVRTSDGVHFQYFGGKIVSRVIIEEIKKSLNL
jgi:hypothetical protein